MNKKEKFAYDIDFGAIMDYVENRFMLVIKDEDWTQEEIDMLNSGIDLHFCYTNDIAVFVLEGGDIDSSDFYFNVQECDWKNHLFATDCLDIDIILLNKANEICFSPICNLLFIPIDFLNYSTIPHRKELPYKCTAALFREKANK